MKTIKLWMCLAVGFSSGFTGWTLHDLSDVLPYNGIMSNTTEKVAYFFMDISCVMSKHIHRIDPTILNLKDSDVE